MNDLTIAERITYPRRRTLRSVLRRAVTVAFDLLSDFQVIGQENVPKEGPVIVVANHFSFIDPAAMVRAVPHPIEFIGGTRMPNAPSTVTWLPKIWGYLPVYRGGVSRNAIRASEAVLQQKGFLGIFPEAGSWATVLRPARPGAAFLAARTGARILPMRSGTRSCAGSPDCCPERSAASIPRIPPFAPPPKKPPSIPGRTASQADRPTTGYAFRPHPRLRRRTIGR